MIRDHRGGVDAQHGLIHIATEINTGRADNLRDDHALGTVDDEGAAVCHHREISHKDFLFLDLFGLLVAETDTDLQGTGIRCVARLALLFRVLWCVIHGVVDEAQLQVAGIVRDGIHILENFLQAGVQEPLIRALLNLQQVRHVHDLRCAGKTLSQRFPVENISWHWHTLLIQERPGELKLFQSLALILLADHAILTSGWGRRVFFPTHNEQGILASVLGVCQAFFVKFHLAGVTAPAIFIFCEILRDI